MDNLASRMREAARGAAFDPAEVYTWFHEGTDPLRVIALNVMLAEKDYRDLYTVLETIDAPHSLFEQYYGLLLARAMLPELDPLERRLLASAIRRACRKRRFRRDQPLMGLSAAILQQIDRGDPSTRR
jgi:hypothetical protein